MAAAALNRRGLSRGIERFIMCLTGPGLALERDAGRVLVPSEGEELWPV